MNITIKGKGTTMMKSTLATGQSSNLIGIPRVDDGKCKISAVFDYLFWNQIAKV